MGHSCEGLGCTQKVKCQTDFQKRRCSQVHLDLLLFFNEGMQKWTPVTILAIRCNSRNSTRPKSTVYDWEHTYESSRLILLYNNHNQATIKVIFRIRHKLIKSQSRITIIYLHRLLPKIINKSQSGAISSI